LPHYNWHWFWAWGTGELGNNGVHALDLARWGLKVDSPKRVTCGGNRYHFNDDWQTPDTCVASFDFGDKGIVWDCQSCDPHAFEGASFGVSFYGEKGAMVMAGEKVRVYDLNDKLVREITGTSDDTVHFANFSMPFALEPLTWRYCRRRAPVCHLGNIAWRSGQTIDAIRQFKIVGDKSSGPRRPPLSAVGEPGSLIFHATYRRRRSRRNSGNASLSLHG
jgi:predicted dehydrogenase